MSVFPNPPPPYTTTHPDVTSNPQTVYNSYPNYGMQGKQMPPAPMGTVPTSGTITTTYRYGVQPKRVFSKHPTSLICQHCNTPVVTKPRAEVGTFTWLLAGGLILVGLWLGCCIIPFFIDDCKDIYHDCPNCRNTIDVYKRM